MSKLKRLWNKITGKARLEKIIKDKNVVIIKAADMLLEEREKHKAIILPLKIKLELLKKKEVGA